MKKLLGIVVLGLLWSATVLASDITLKCLSKEGSLVSIIINEPSNKIIFNGYEVKTKINWGSKVKFRHPDPNKFNAKLTNDEDVVLDRITGKLSFPASSSDHDHIFYKPFVCQKSKALF